MIDAHTHIQFAAYNKDRKEVIARAKSAGVKMITVGTQRDTSRAGIELAKQHEGWIYATVGLHPIHTSKSFHDAQELGIEGSPSTTFGKSKGGAGFTSRGEEFDPAYYLELAKDPHVVAIGECGLDYFRVDGDVAQTKERQKDVFRKHIAMAEEVKKPLMLHCWPSAGTDDAYEDILEIISNYQFPISKIVHFYVGSLEMAKKLLDAGFSFTFGGVITITRDYDEIVRYIPLEKILSETDAPYVAPAPYRGKRNEPAYVIEIIRKLAELKNASFEETDRCIMENANRVFGI